MCLIVFFLSIIREVFLGRERTVLGFDLLARLWTSTEPSLDQTVAQPHTRLYPLNHNASTSTGRRSLPPFPRKHWIAQGTHHRRWFDLFASYWLLE